MASFKASGLTWISLFTDASLFARLWRSALLQFMGQMCGATAMKYYLPALFQALGLSRRVSLLAGGIESTMKIGCTLVDMVIIDRAGRRTTMTAGAAVMAFSMLVSRQFIHSQAAEFLTLRRNRSTALSRRYTPAISTTPPTLSASYSSSSTPSASAWASAQRHGYTGQRYRPPIPPQPPTQH